MITNLREGTVLNHNFGVETDDYLEIKVEGLASPQSTVTVNGVLAERFDRQFSAVIRLTQKINKITAVASDMFGDFQQTITVVWDKKSFKRYTFFFDDCSFFMTAIAKQRPASIFDEMFLGRLKKIHDLYGTMFILNLFYHDDHHDFSISDFPVDYKAEFAANSDWLKLSFHAKSEFPDRPYQNATAEKLAEDYDLIYNEVCRFAGPESFIAPEVIHWGMTNTDNLRVLRERGVRCLTGGFLGSATRIGETHAVRVTDIGYHYEQDVVHHLEKARTFYDKRYDICLHFDDLCCNLSEMDKIYEIFKNIDINKTKADTIVLMSHEQYSYSDYSSYLPDHLDRIETACRLATEAGYKCTFFSNGFLGNMSWEE